MASRSIDTLPIDAYGLPIDIAAFVSDITAFECKSG